MPPEDRSAPTSAVGFDRRVSISKSEGAALRCRVDLGACATEPFDEPGIGHSPRLRSASIISACEHPALRQTNTVSCLAPSLTSNEGRWSSCAGQTTPSGVEVAAEGFDKGASGGIHPSLRRSS